MKWEKIFANYVTDKGLISKNTNSLYSLIKKTKKQKKIQKKTHLKQKQPNRKRSRRSKQIFTQRRHTNGHQAHEMTLHITDY